MICFSRGEESDAAISGYCPACNQERKRWASGMYEHYAELLTYASPEPGSIIAEDTP